MKKFFLVLVLLLGAHAIGEAQRCGRFGRTQYRSNNYWSYGNRYTNNRAYTNSRSDVGAFALGVVVGTLSGIGNNYYNNNVVCYRPQLRYRMVTGFVTQYDCYGNAYQVQTSTMVPVYD